MTEKYTYSSMSDLKEPIRKQQVSPVEIVRACLKRIEELNPKINAFITVLADQALEQARAADSEITAGRWRGPLHGIPVGIKDFYDTAGIKTTGAFEPFKDRVPTRDAAVVTKLKEAGAVVIGKMNMHELGMGTTGLIGYFGPVHNPWNLENIPGGSSAGSAAAIASGMCYATLDTDAIGSTRLPAACCGVVGFKGTYGLINPSGVLEGTQDPGEMIRWLNHVGITTRSVADTALMLNALAERSEHTPANYFDELAKGQKLRVGVGDNFKADPEVTEAFGNAVATIGAFGYAILQTAVPFGDPFGGLANIESDRKAIAAQAFKDIDVLLLPTTTTTVPTVNEAGANPQALSPENTVFANYYGLPAISVPCGFDVKGLPLGLQIVGPTWGEGAVLRLANQYQMATEFGQKHPFGDGSCESGLSWR